jgi:phasin family protein
MISRPSVSTNENPCKPGSVHIAIMKTEADSNLGAYQRQMAVTQEICEAFIEGTGRIETVWFEQTRKAIEEQLKFFKASAAVRDPQGLAALHSAFFSHSPEDAIKAQRQIVDVAIETQSKISDALRKHMNALKGAKPLWGANGDKNADDSAGALYSAWHKAFQDAIALASIGVKVPQLSTPASGSTAEGDKVGAHSKQR